MIKSIKVYAIIVFITFFTMGFLRPMEVNIQDYSEALENENSNKITKNKSKARLKKRKNRSGQIKIDDAERQAKIEEEKPKAIQINDIRKLLNALDKPLSYAYRLNFVANLLLLQWWIIEEFKAMSLHSATLLKLSSKSPITCFSITDDGKGLCGHEKNTYGITKQLLTPETQFLAVKLIAPIISSHELWESSKLINDFYNKSTALLNHENEEIVAIAKFVKSTISGYWLYNNITALWKNFLDLLVDAKFCGFDSYDEIEDSILVNGIRYITIEWLVSNETFVMVQNSMPKFIYLITRLEEFNDYINNELEKKANLLDLDITTAIDEEITEITQSCGKEQKIYEELYKTITSELSCVVIDNKLNSYLYNSAFLAPKIKVLPDTLKVSLLKSDFRDYEEENKRAYDFIAHLVPLQGYTKKVNICQVKKKKKSRRRRNRKNTRNREQEASVKHKFNELLNEDSRDLSVESFDDSCSNIFEMSQENEQSLRLPSYANRVLSWFDSEYIETIVPKPNTDSLLYHKYSPLADFFIKKYGIKMMQKNNTNMEFVDTAYYMAGQIKDRNGAKRTVVFGICFGRNGLCYHRGFDEQEDYGLSQEFAYSKLKYDFPDLSKEPVVIKKKLNLGVEDIYKDTEYTETEFGIEINDSVNHVTITLYKPTQFSSELN